MESSNRPDLAGFKFLFALSTSKRWSADFSVGFAGGVAGVTGSEGAVALARW